MISSTSIVFGSSERPTRRSNPTSGSMVCIEAPNDRTGEDRISELPDHVLCEILSYLSTRVAVKTSTLSTRWRSLWKWVPALDIDPIDFPDDNAFISFVEGFLGFQSESYLHRFCVEFNDRAIPGDPFRYESRVNPVDTFFFCKSWIGTVLKRRIQHLEVRCLISETYMEIPLTLYKCETLVRIKLQGVILNTPEVVYLPCVKIMGLKRVQYANESTLETLISCCPVLEDLTLYKGVYDSLILYSVCSPTLKSFSLEAEDYSGEGEHHIVINAPELKYLKLVGAGFEEVVVNDSGSLVEAYLDADFNEFYGLLKEKGLSKGKRRMMRRFFIRISSVRHLIISKNTLEVIHQFSELKLLPQFCNLSHLQASLQESSVEILPALLESCPNLRSLDLWIDRSWVRRQLRFSHVPSCLLSTLEAITLRGCLVEEEMGMEIARYLLENSAVLKKLFLCRFHYHEMVEKSAVLKELLTVPRRYEVVLEDLCHLFWVLKHLAHCLW